ncbi:hypothetical protein [Arsenicicoccus bolidensis]|uniref:Uncharacterized protein n=1 Tax=Arsenicicoccus bolidensis TaxID=229480 RepID=A0ABS9Q2Y4_9MICO|nr:hypothetical protein [Arsenicicoccus bolidensis]MCG7322248.1 hypothetical protein [Arsenicicoccus bolidensis]
MRWRRATSRADATCRGREAVNAAGGDLEAQLARKASGGSLFREPQINAWYAVKGDRVLPLNDEARAAVGAGMALRDYQRTVHAKYADKLPGSGYDRSGTAGGFAAGGAPAAAQPVAGQPAAQRSAQTSDSPAPMVAGGLGLGLGLVAAAGAVVAAARRLRTHA